MNRQQRRAAATVGRRTEGPRQEAPERSNPGCAVGPALAWRIGQAAYAECVKGRHTGCSPMLEPLLAAWRSVLTGALAATVEEMRTEHLGVTVLSLEKARFPQGWTWWEWDPRIEGRLPALPDQVALDRAGALVETDATGKRGTMYFVFSGQSDHGGMVLEPAPLACAFDWREDYEPPPCLGQRATAEDYRRAMAHPSLDATLGELEASPVFCASLTRRFGLIENRFFTAAARTLGISDPNEWMLDPELLACAGKEVMEEACFMLALAIAVRSAPLAVTLVSRGAKLAESAGATRTAPFGFAVLDLAPTVFPGRAA